ncbi:YeiH family protein [Bartonella sp. HY761]|uniref:YeiH family protein n=1 Tax=Bartonella sp. HY761 TaxID=2979330 RepID=UPI00220BA879|nr:YeiH family protein [Bartonella sp. HY761]UXN07746.1 YeiH family protein [Bartonella sp. HY761]
MKNSPTDLLFRFFPGIALCGVISAASFGLQAVGQLFFGHYFPEALVLAIILGVICRSIFGSVQFPAFRRFDEGIGFSAHFLLELAVMLLGASISTTIIMQSGLPVLASVAIIVFLSICISYCIARALKLSSTISLLLACGNSICGNSAIAAVAPVIGAKSDDVAPSIAFTAVLGVIAVLCLPLLVPIFGFNNYQYGIFAGMTVYAVPQVLAATAPISAVSVQTGTIVKLIRVLMLGPVIFIISLIKGSSQAEKTPLSRMVPWFIIGFVALAIFRSLGFIPNAALTPINMTTVILTNISMAALGLGVDIRALARSGARVILAAFLSLIALCTLAMIFIFYVL